MLTSISIRNFKNLKDVSIELGNSVVFIGPNNSGKTTALQAIALWNIGVKKLNSKIASKSLLGNMVTINRKELVSIPVPYANLLWNDLLVKKPVTRRKRQTTERVNIEITIKGTTNDKNWLCGLEFDYANEESFYCSLPRALNLANPDGKIIVPPETSKIKIAFLPPLSGLAMTEPKWEPGRINVLIGEGQTAQVLRNLCYQIYDSDDSSRWNKLTETIKNLFGVEIDAPEYIAERGEITLRYKDAGKREHFDLSASGRGLQQTLLLLAYLYANPHSVLLVDEPDAHLEIIRQRQIYNLISELASQQESQLIVASHSEVVLDEAAGKSTVIAFVGHPHVLNNRKSQVRKSLKEIGFDHYYQAEMTGWVLYLEGSTDLAILQAFAKRLNHIALEDLNKSFVHYVFNQPLKAANHFFGLQEAKNDLVGLAIFDRLDRDLPDQSQIVWYQWKRRELENYLCMEETLLTYAEYDIPSDLFGKEEKEKREGIMRECIQKITEAFRILKKFSPWSPDIKASDDFLDILFEDYFERLKLPNIMAKSNYHELVQFVPLNKIDPEIIQVLDLIHETALKAKPRTD